MIEGILYKTRSSENKKATFSIKENFFYIKHNDDILKKGDIATLAISPRLGNVERKITFEDGEVFSTKENDAIDNLFFKITNKKSFLHTFETNNILILLSLFCVILFSFTFVKWGVPYISKKIAYALPFEVNHVISSNTLKMLDEYVFKPSELTSNKKDKINSEFMTNILPLVQKNNEIGFKIHFRLLEEGNKSIANAFALPNGDMILTDKFVQLSQNQNEINSVILHEMGHVQYRHSLQRLIQSSFIAVIVMFISGDTTVLGDMGIGLGTLFLTSNYSRKHELEADLFAFKKMMLVKIDPENFVNIMKRISSDIPTTTNDDDITSYLSSHPDTLHRINIAKQYSQCFKEGLSVCVNK